MLTELRVHNLALISTAELELGAGLTVLSGETGAGKTALLSSLKLLIGERGDATVVGSADDETRVEALFIDNATGETSDAPGIKEHLIVRRIKEDGRSRCYLDDSLVTVRTLSEILGPSVDLYGQHEHQSLLKAAEQLRILDEFAGSAVSAALVQYQTNLHNYQEAFAELNRLRELGNSSAAEREQAAFVVREVARVAPKPGEYEALEAELPRLQHGEQLTEAARTALSMLRDENGALERLDLALKALENLRGIDSALDEPLEQLSSLSIALEENTADVARYAQGIDYDPEKLQVALDRLGELDGLSRRFGPGMDQVFALVERSEQLLQGQEDTQESITAAERKLATEKKELERAASDLAALRESASREFLAQLNNSVADLALSGATLEFSLHELPFERWSFAGSQSFELLYSPAPHVPARPLAKIASGGELSRVMLAIKSLLQTSDRPMTLVFDEIDAGVGGNTANAVAERLSSLATQHQVIVITHLAQIAACADRHFLVSKTISGEDTHTTITILSRKERVGEIARMLSGSSDKEAIAHAEKLLKGAGR